MHGPFQSDYRGVANIEGADEPCRVSSVDTALLFLWRRKLFNVTRTDGGSATWHESRSSFERFSYMQPGIACPFVADQNRETTQRQTSVIGRAPHHGASQPACVFVGAWVMRPLQVAHVRPPVVILYVTILILCRRVVVWGRTGVSGSLSLRFGPNPCWILQAEE